MLAAVSFLGLLCIQIQPVSGFVLNIAPYEEECFLIRTHNWKKGQVRLLQGHYHIISDPSDRTPDAVHVFVMDEHEKVYFQSTTGKISDVYQVAVGPNQKYWICIQNDAWHHYGLKEMDQSKHPDDKDREVGFGYRIQTMVKKASDVIDLDQHSTTWSQIAADLHLSTEHLMEHYQYMRIKEARHREVVEKTFSDIFLGSVAEAVMTLVVALGQVFYLRRFLEKKRYLWENTS